MSLSEVRADVDEQIADAWRKCNRLLALPLGELRALYAQHRTDAWPGVGKAAGRLSVMWQVKA